MLPLPGRPRNARACVATLWKLRNRRLGALSDTFPMPHNEIQALLDAAVDAVIMIDHRGSVTAFNRSAERLFGYEAPPSCSARASAG